MAQLLLEQALRLAVTSATAPPPPAAPAPAPAPAAGLHASDAGRTAQQQQQQLRLASFSTNYASIAVLKMLPTRSLTHLQFNLAGAQPSEYHAAADVLASFSNLQQLQLEKTSSWQTPAAVGIILAGIAQLSKLTQLHLLAQPPPLQQLQQLLHPLPLDLTAITQLEELVTDELHPESVLPGQLRELTLTYINTPGCWRPFFALRQLQRLSMRLVMDYGATDAVLRLAAQLATLTHVSLEYTYECLSGLTGLRDLCITEHSMLAPGDALALTNLTRLVLGVMCDGVDDVAAAAIALNLTQLRHLGLRWCALGSADGDLAEVGELVPLSELHLEGNSS
ncbi:hypothetical protein COO60DRAFT_1639295 [Scenedesmus sp. NREL 46B-D3]|nr:hypothetical protein COO60DRAFT_1639295 [Scenedesmus sp. NREL 46B-D3]